jgi:hypothetical protein
MSPTMHGTSSTCAQFLSRLSNTTLPRKPRPPVINMVPDISVRMLKGSST